jgi:ferritin
LWFKSKAEEYRVSVDRVKPRVSDSSQTDSTFLDEFVRDNVTEARLLQGLEYLREMNISVDEKATGTFLKWIVGDCIREEADQLKGLDVNALKSLKKHITSTAHKWYRNYVKCN